MNDFTFYFGNGWDHIVSTQALDHLLFLVALMATCFFTGWKQAILMVTLFTIGHSMTLAASIYEVFRFDTKWVEFLIPLTIVLTSLFNLFLSEKKTVLSKQYIAAFFFGLIHGMGFANTLRFMLSRSQSPAMPLAGFSIGIEIAQLTVSFGLLVLPFILVKTNKITASGWMKFASSLAGVVAIYMCVTRWPV